MKKLIAAALLCASTAFAQANTQTPPQTTDTGAPVPEKPRSQQGRKLGTGVEATEVTGALKRAGDKAQDVVGLQTEKDGTFKMDKAFDLRGTVKDPAGGRVTVVRPGLPDAGLDVRKNTRVTLNGKRVAAEDLPEGAQVRAKFQLEGTEVVALSLEATGQEKGARQGTGGSGEAKKAADQGEDKAERAADRAQDEARQEEPQRP